MVELKRLIRQMNIEKSNLIKIEKDEMKSMSLFEWNRVQREKHISLFKIMDMANEISKLASYEIEALKYNKRDYLTNKL